MNHSPLYRNIAPLDDSEGHYRVEYRCPININTASYPVLMAVLTHLETKNNIYLPPSEVRNLAALILDFRKKGYVFNTKTFSF